MKRRMRLEDFRALSYVGKENGKDIYTCEVQGHSDFLIVNHCEDEILPTIISKTIGDLSKYMGSDERFKLSLQIESSYGFSFYESQIKAADSAEELRGLYNRVLNGREEFSLSSEQQHILLDMLQKKMGKPKGIYIRSLTEEDRNAVDDLDELSGNYVAQWLEGNTDYAWGLFADSKLIGYCSIGEAEDVSAVISSYPGYTCDSLILSDVFVLPEYRKQGLGLYMVEQVIKERNKENNLIFLKPFCDSLGYFYDKLGFRYIDGNEEMVWDHDAICSEAGDFPI